MTDRTGRDVGLRAGMLVAIIFAVSALLGFLREVVIAGYFGATREADAFLVALLIPNAFSSLLADASLGVAFVPVFVSHIAPRESKEQREVVGSLFTLASLLLVPLTLVLILAAPILARLFAPGFTASQEQLTVVLMRIMLPSVFFLGMANVVTGVLHSFKRFGAASAASAVLNFAIVATTIPLAHRFGILAPAAGVLLGNTVQLAVQLPALLKTGIGPSIGLKFRDPAFRRMWIILWPILVAFTLSQAAGVIEKSVLSYLPAGSIAALNYADKVAGGPARIFAMAISVVVFPFLAEKAWDEASDMPATLVKSLNVAALLTIPWLAIFVILRRPIVTLLFERGAFDARATAMVALPMAIYCFGQYAAGIATAINNSFYAHHDSKTPMTVGVLLRFGGIGLGVLAIPLLQHAGMAVGTAVAANLTVAILLYRLKRKEPTLDLGRFARTVVSVLVASAFGAGVAWVVFSLIPKAAVGGSLSSEVASLVVPLVAGFAGYLLAAIVLRIPEMRELFQRLFTLVQGRKETPAPSAPLE